MEFLSYPNNENRPNHHSHISFSSYYHTHQSLRINIKHKPIRTRARNSQQQYQQTTQTQTTFSTHTLNLRIQMIIVFLQPKQVLLFLVASSSLFHAAHARSGATPGLAPRATNEGANTPFAMLLVLFACALFITCFCSFYVRYCAERNVVVGGNDAVRSSPKGIDPEVLATCPVVFYSAIKTGHRHVALQCAVCLGEFGDLDALRLLPRCGHVFHTSCIDTWLASHSTCPVCRAEIGSENGAHQVLGESSMTRIEVDGSIGKGDGLSKVSASSGVLVRSHSTGHSSIEVGKSVERLTRTQIVEGKGGNLMVMKRSASYDVVLQIEDG